MSEIIGVWFRRDFRLNDQTALFHCLERIKESNGKWVAIFHLDPQFTKDLTPHHQYFYQTVYQFKQYCENLGITLHVIYGPITEFINKIVQAIPTIKAIYYNKDEVGKGKARDDLVNEELEKRGISISSFLDTHLTSAAQGVKADGQPYKVYTPYFRTWFKQEKPLPLTIDIFELKNFNYHTDKIDLYGEDYFINIINKINRNWGKLGESEALNRLEQFTSNIYTYHIKRDIPSEYGTSQLSPFLKTGVISIRTVYKKILDCQLDVGEGAHTYIKELAWREFYNMLYHFYPDSKLKAFREEYHDLDWETDPERFERWKEGITGFPIVDAGMRQLKNEGWMHNRLRMITASFLTKDYLIDWRMGEQYFEKMLIDYEEASNIGGWQWAASVGSDAVPYFRVFNPTLQSERFDPLGEYIKKYIPELNHLPKKYIHQPWKVTEKSKFMDSFVVGKDYPAPTIDHQVQRQKAIAFFKGGQ
ncbi:cryptochrome/photolyase family protein [Alkalihalobacterium elongatum]|uniref:cryptochrome/photolyase family protein n=1 Tax=Alkalihalobacterium elongatum TaxID=2675466 RepID=UPI002E2E2501|nr:deoxyribodipyrimidine photo-lyase [Alkalihalobacterium elongatum]